MHIPDIVGKWVVGIMIAVFIMCWINTEIKKNSLRENKGKAKAVIIRVLSIKHSDYFEYEFKVNGVKYNGGADRSFKDDLGDTIIISYDKTDPDNNKYLKD